MANRASLAARIADTNDIIDKCMTRIADVLGLEVPDAGQSPRGKDPDIRAALSQERIASFLKLVADQMETDADPEPLFHGRPLSDFDGMSDDEILDIKGIGKKALEEIKAARAQRDGK
jgi:hypothetical protein